MHVKRKLVTQDLSCVLEHLKKILIYLRGARFLTDVAARGLDVPDTQFIINADMPTSIEVINFLNVHAP